MKQSRNFSENSLAFDFLLISSLSISLHYSITSSFASTRLDKSNQLIPNNWYQSLRSIFRRIKMAKKSSDGEMGSSTPSDGGSRYFLIIIDDYTWLIWVAMLQQKSDAFEAFKRFKTLAEIEKGVKLKALRTDGGGEFTSIEFSSYCNSNGIKRELTAPYSPQQNGVAERKNRTVMSMVLAMLKAKDLPK